MYPRSYHGPEDRRRQHRRERHEGRRLTRQAAEPIEESPGCRHSPRAAQAGSVPQTQPPETHETGHAPKKRDILIQQEAAENGDAAALTELAETYRRNGYEAESYLPLLCAAAAQSYEPAFGLYGYALCLTGEQRLGEAVLRELAAKKDGQGAFLYSEYLFEQGQREIECRYWLELAAEAGCIPAYRKLSAHFTHFSPESEVDLGYYPDITTAAAWMKKAADAGDADSAYDYARMLSRLPYYTWDEIYSYYRLAYDRGRTDAVFPLADHERRPQFIVKRKLLYHAMGVPQYDIIRKPDRKDAPRAVRLYLDAAAKAPELRGRIMKAALCQSSPVWDERFVKKVLQGLAEMGYAPALRRLKLLRQG